MNEKLCDRVEDIIILSTRIVLSFFGNQSIVEQMRLGTCEEVGVLCC